MALSIPRLQSKSHQSSGKTKTKPHQQYHVYFSDPDQDEHHVSEYTHSLLVRIAKRAKVPSLLITSTVRDTHEQAVAMYDNLVANRKMRYAAAGRSVLAVASADIKANKSRDDTISDMETKIDSVGLRHVTAHADSAGLNTVDLSIKHFDKFDDPSGAKARIIQALKDAVDRGELSRFGWPQGPTGKAAGKLFNDDACLHVEIPQPVIGDFPVSETVKNTA